MQVGDADKLPKAPAAILWKTGKPIFVSNYHYFTVENSNDQVIRFEEIFYATKDRLYSFVCGLVRDDSTVQDYLQQCYMKLWENWNSIDTHNEVLPLLFTYARNLVIDHLRKNARIVWMDSLEAFTGWESEDRHTEQILAQKETAKELQELLQLLPRRRREVFTLIKLRGLTYKETAEYLDIAVSTVEKHMHEAYRFLTQENAMRILIGCLLLKEFGG